MEDRLESRTWSQAENSSKRYTCMCARSCVCACCLKAASPGISDEEELEWPRFLEVSEADLCGWKTRMLHKIYSRQTLTYTAKQPLSQSQRDWLTVQTYCMPYWWQHSCIRWDKPEKGCSRGSSRRQPVSNLSGFQLCWIQSTSQTIPGTPGWTRRRPTARGQKSIW